MPNNDQVFILDQGPTPNYMPSMPLPADKRSADFIEKIDPKHLIDELYNRLRGRELMSNGKWEFVPELVDYALSERGARDICTIVRPLASLVTTIGNWKDPQVKARLLNIMDETNELMLAHWEDYNIHNASQFTYVKSLLTSTVTGALMQAREGSTGRLIKENVTENVNVNEDRRPRNSWANIANLGRR